LPYNIYFETNEENGEYIYPNLISRIAETNVYDGYQVIKLTTAAGYLLAEEEDTSNNFIFCEYNQISGSEDLTQSKNMCTCK